MSHYDKEHYNLAGEYIKSREEGGRCMTLDDYVSMIRWMGKTAIHLEEDDIDRALRLLDYPA